MRNIVIATTLSFFVTIAPVIAMAQDVPGHPRENEINSRLENQQDRISAGSAQGQLNARQAARDSAVDNRVAREESRDEALHNGHITKAEQAKMNRQLNRDSARIHDERDK